jgi:hypothetical protein
MKPIREMTGAEFAAFVQGHLRENGINLVLSGGACVSIYSNGKYVSKDLDFVGTHFTRLREVRAAMKQIGLMEEERYFRHPDSEFFVEILPGPLAVGQEPVKMVAECKVVTGTLRMISPTDCVKDRLTAYYHWNDLQSLEQAALVAENSDIDIQEVERWSKAEGKFKEFRRVRDRLVRQTS